MIYLKIAFVMVQNFAAFHCCCFLLDQNYSEVIVDWRQIHTFLLYTAAILHTHLTFWSTFYLQKRLHGDLHILSTYNSTLTYIYLLQSVCKYSLSKLFCVVYFYPFIFVFFIFLQSFSLYLIKMKKVYLWCWHMK